ncbi:ABC transporter permease [Aliidongia dinghuensis]|uniref:ABC transporter permease n=1 Tax=Aliidongia dinghuensis TaxID=1867774 RepID=A0A8J3E472_9PROT|nr:ABC transporter permease [Aliidongia dinghuensis]GGF21683.1 ABC transporter permease [Aliidongia dinghuensis]
MRRDLPVLVDYLLIPALNLALAFLVGAVVLALIGVSPSDALGTLLDGAFGSLDGLGYTLYYATTFIFTGLAVAIPYQAGLFNIGGEGQATLGGLGVTLVCQAMGGYPLWLTLPLAILVAALFGAGWAAVPAVLQVKRGSHIVITTIMFNFLAAAFMTYLLIDMLRAPGDPSPETGAFPASTALPYAHEWAQHLGLAMEESPLNLSFLVALAVAFLAWLFIRRTRWGYEIRATGHNPSAAAYAAIPVGRVTVLAVCLGGACAGLVGINEVMGVLHRLVLGFTAGAGIVGIAVALMGRNHPFGIVLAAILFGALYQGGAELAFDYPQVTRDIIVVMDGLVILFCGALENMLRAPVTRAWQRWRAVPA